MHKMFKFPGPHAVRVQGKTYFLREDVVAIFLAMDKAQRENPGEVADLVDIASHLLTDESIQLCE